jgi:hypothetical protein
MNRLIDASHRHRLSLGGVVGLSLGGRIGRAPKMAIRTNPKLSVLKS